MNKENTQVNASVIKPEFTLKETNTHYVLVSPKSELAHYPKHYPKNEVVHMANNFLSSWGYTLKDEKSERA